MGCYNRHYILYVKIYLSFDSEIGGDATEEMLVPEKGWLTLPTCGEEGGVKRSFDLSCISRILKSLESPTALLIEPAVLVTFGELTTGLPEVVILEDKIRRLSSQSKDWGPPVAAPPSLLTRTSLIKGMNTWFDSSSEL